MSEHITGSDATLLLMTGIGACGACVAALMQCVLRSRCETIKCCGAECTRAVLPLNRHLWTRLLSTESANEVRCKPRGGGGGLFPGCVAGCSPCLSCSLGREKKHLVIHGHTLWVMYFHIQPSDLFQDRAGFVLALKQALQCDMCGSWRGCVWS